MRKVIQIILFIFLIFLITEFYKRYFKEKDEVKIDKKISETPSISQNNNNTIQNLEYKISINEDNNYKISSKISEIVYQNNVELIKMFEVKATFTDKNQTEVTITSEEAIYNNENYNTIFKKNIIIKYLNNLIYGDILNLDLEKNIMIVSGNVKYSGFNSELTADNIKLNLITKKIDIFMDEKNKKVVINTKE